jgi:hypothetical protein
MSLGCQVYAAGSGESVGGEVRGPAHPGRLLEKERMGVSRVKKFPRASQRGTLAIAASLTTTSQVPRHDNNIYLWHLNMNQDIV